MAFSLEYNTFNGILKPDLPYIKGYEFSATEHFPPEPQINHFFSLTPDEAAKRITTDVLTRSLSRKPILGQLGSRCLRLEIRMAIRVGDEITSQIILVDVISGHLSNTPVVAKLYDPLYHDHSDNYVDPFLFVDVEYARESAAYRYLQSQGQKNIPEYYGSYSTEIGHSDQFRTVRLILIEHVIGSPMTSLRAKDFPDHVQKTFMKQIVDIESQLYKINLEHGDTHPRNVVIDPSEPRVTFIDFGHALIGRSSDPQDEDLERQSLPGMYISPLLRWFKTRRRLPISRFEEWITWDWNEWLFDTYSSDKENMTLEMAQRWLPAGVRQQFLSIGDGPS
ncbi:uncharacterized protein BO80DRAFT_482329 [Aspergillus ibericus CBS 121593]|uniref:Protein kinase domain-containing protein n=1 Tax=Aspergillus ibericus CBS 121593 TaxID=1448316 RepID=A0A395GP69_9EURO|nr:hypothetical protein BO80DRAFT_482329 [Aspergillus ibericus CBS 121593]RAK97310.1 hypothetical protein BO80DRAFT_482329 [Aspergillus ibericus CBS 121593]